MNIIESYKSFTMVSVEQRAKVLVNFLVENHPLTSCSIICYQAKCNFSHIKFSKKPRIQADF